MMRLMTKEAACMKLKWNNSRLIILAINMDSTLFNLAAEMIEFQTLKLKKGHSSCWVTVFVYLCPYVQMWVNSIQPPIVYADLCNKGQNWGSGQSVWKCVCVWYVFTPITSLTWTARRRGHVHINTNESSRFPESTFVVPVNVLSLFLHC